MILAYSEEIFAKLSMHKTLQFYTFKLLVNINNSALFVANENFFLSASYFFLQRLERNKQQLLRYLTFGYIPNGSNYFQGISIISSHIFFCFQNNSPTYLFIIIAIYGAKERTSSTQHEILFCIVKKIDEVNCHQSDTLLFLPSFLSFFLYYSFPPFFLTLQPFLLTLFRLSFILVSAFPPSLLFSASLS